MQTVSPSPPSGRYLCFTEREEIALLRARDVGVRDILAVTPWRYVWRNYMGATGDRWR